MAREDHQRVAGGGGGFGVLLRIGDEPVAILPAEASCGVSQTEAMLPSTGNSALAP